MDKYILKTWVDFNAWCKSSIETLALDFECDGADYLNLGVAGWSMCNGESICYVDILDNPEQQILINLLRSVMENKVKCLILHNAPFDMRILYQLDIPHTDNIYCTMTVAHLLDENKPKGLKWLSTNVLNKKRETLTFFDAITEGFHSTKFYDYATADADDTWDLYQYQLPILKKDTKLWDLWYNIERPFQYCLRDLSMNGVLVDKENLLQAQEEVSEELRELEIEMYKSGGISYYTQMLLGGGYEIKPRVNLNSPKQLVDLLQHLGVSLTETTDTKQLSTKNSVLESVKHQHEFVGLLLKYRSMSKLLNAFLIPLPKFIESDGRIRANWLNTVAVTGRLACNAPNLMQLPKDK